MEEGEEDQFFNPMNYCTVKVEVEEQEEVEEKPLSIYPPEEEEDYEDYHQTGSSNEPDPLSINVGQHSQNSLPQLPSELKGRGRNRISNIAKTSEATFPVAGHINAYTCEICSKSFNHTGSLSNHRKRHLDPQLPCPVCQKTFYTQAEVRRHLGLAHGPQRKPVATASAS